MTKHNTAALVPAHNEELVLGKTLESLLAQLSAEDIYVVDDGSEDRSAAIARRYTSNVLRLDTNVGKADALNAAIRSFELPERYRFLMFMDADTQASPQFAALCLGHFARDTHLEVACVVGRVQGQGGSWVGKYRLWEYAIAHSVHKQAQAHMQSILVVPGCATMFRADVFKKVDIPKGTFTEDMDFTFLLHRSKYSKMLFEPDAVVYTQDPQTLGAFVRQVHRWYMGFWQAMRKHNLPWHGQSLDFEAGLLATEGLFNGLVCIALIVLMPALIAGHLLHLLLIPALLDLFVFFLPTLIWSSEKSKQNLVRYLPQFYFLRLLTSLLFFYAFFHAAMSKRHFFTWDTQRFKVAE